jgi:zinc D-Ala-D-Ala dipeptidase
VSESAAMSIAVEQLAGHADFCRLSEIDGLNVDLRYAGTNNFSERVLYQNIDCAWLRREAVQGLRQCISWLRAQHPQLQLLLLDALRPQRVQEAIWRDVKGTNAQHYFADPVRGSIHTFGMAVDVTLIGSDGRELDMGSGFDEMSLASHPALEAEHLASGVLTERQVTHRQWLREAMAVGGFEGIPSEWWHFNHGDPTDIRTNWPRVV